MKDCVLFLSGRYQQTHLDYYRSLCRGRFKVAVDGGHRFFALTGIVPDLLIGDFDSLKGLPQKVSRRTQVMAYPVEKDRTDCHLALDYCLEHRARRIDIVQPNVGEPDHFTANLMLLTRSAANAVKGYQPEIRLVNYAGEFRYLRNEMVTVKRAQGDTVSVIPLSPAIRYTCKGTAFDITKLRVVRGETVSSRNRILKPSASFAVSGEAWLFRNYHRRHKT
jgi:thiamine pyrophosphokinase